MNTQSEPAAVYGRVSTSDQKNSMDAQDVKLREYCKFKGLDLTGLVYGDEAVSGSVPISERSGGAKLVRKLKAGGINHLVVAKLDRLGRRASDIITFVEELHKLEIVLHIVDLNGDSLSTSGPFGRLFLNILAAFAEFERAQIIDRIKKTCEHKFSQGEQIGYAPFGWKAVPTDRINKRGLPINTMVDDPEEQKWLIRCKEMRDRGIYLAAIAHELTKAGVPTKRNGTMRAGKVVAGKWDPNTIRRMLANKHATRLFKALKEKAA